MATDRMALLEQLGHAAAGGDVDFLRTAVKTLAEVLMELEVARPGEKTLDAAVAQIEARGYDAELQASGAMPIHAFAVAFDGKDVRVRMPVGGTERAPTRDPERTTR